MMELICVFEDCIDPEPIPEPFVKLQATNSSEVGVSSQRALESLRFPKQLRFVQTGFRRGDQGSISGVSFLPQKRQN